jgi:predicted Zn-dependent protease
MRFFLPKSLRPSSPLRAGALTIALGLLIASCASVPLTGRKQVKLLPESQLVQMSLAAYNDFLSQSNVVESGSEKEMVERVARNLSLAVNDIMRVEGHQDILADMAWDVHLVQDPLVNAWAMPGGKITIYTGILPVTKTEAGLAAVMGHEMAHAIARHGNERMSQGLAAELGLAAGSIALDQVMSDKPQMTRDMIMMAAGIGTQVGVMLPFSRLHESEADELGLIFMAHAGYDPAEAIPFWQRMSQLGSDPVPEFLSTHPSHDTRIRRIRDEYLPVALTYYQDAQKRGGAPSGTTRFKKHERQAEKENVTPQGYQISNP